MTYKQMECCNNGTSKEVIMKKILVLVGVWLLISSLSYAQVSQQPKIERSTLVQSMRYELDGRGFVKVVLENTVCDLDDDTKCIVIERQTFQTNQTKTQFRTDQVAAKTNEENRLQAEIDKIDALP